jgi:NADH-quinone oxidoreductase subunit J
MILNINPALLHTLCTILLLVFTCLVILSRNPAHSLFFLILVFVTASFSIILFGHDFIGLLFIIIYVGAISVLFLFVVMMLDLKTVNMTSADMLKTILALALILLLFVLITSWSNESFLLFSKRFDINVEYLEFDNSTNISSFSQCLFNYYSICIVIGGLILLTALIGSVQLCFDYTSNIKNLKQFHNKQLSKDHSCTISFMKATKVNTFKK